MNGWWSEMMRACRLIGTSFCKMWDFSVSMILTSVLLQRLLGIRNSQSLLTSAIQAWRLVCSAIVHSWKMDGSADAEKILAAEDGSWQPQTSQLDTVWHWLWRLLVTNGAVLCQCCKPEMMMTMQLQTWNWEVNLHSSSDILAINFFLVIASFTTNHFILFIYS